MNIKIFMQLSNLIAILIKIFNFYIHYFKSLIYNVKFFYIVVH